MPIPVASRWWILTLLIIGVLLLISALALDRPNVVWQAHEPHCPHCRHEVKEFSNRCGVCRGEFDWAIAGEEQSPISDDSLTVLEAEWVHARVEELGLEVAARRVSEATGLTEKAASDYIQNVTRGDCGWCGGTTRDLDTKEEDAEEPCPCCFGTGNSVACGGDRRVRLGDSTARRSFLAYEAELADLLRSRAGAEERGKEARRLAEEFLSVHAGTQEAARIRYWADIANPRTEPGKLTPAPRTVTQVARSRLDQVLEALRPTP